MKDLAYYLTLFKILGHETWRSNLCGRKDGFKEDVENAPAKPRITHQVHYRIDRLTGEIEKIS